MVRALFKSYFRELVVTKIFLKLLRRVVGVMDMSYGSSHGLWKDFQ